MNQPRSHPDPERNSNGPLRRRTALARSAALRRQRRLEARRRWPGLAAVSGGPVRWVWMIAAVAIAPGCETGRPGALTPGAAKKYIQRGVTTQADVVELFGTPNIITQKDGHEMWVYDKVSSRQTNAAFGIGGLGGGAGSGGAGGGGLGFGASSTERSETTVMLIVYFGEHDVVSDYKISQSKF